MNKHLFSLRALSAFIVCLIMVGVDISASEPVRKTCWDEGWKFYRGCAANAEQPSFDDAGWRVVNLPHDWSVEPLPTRRDGLTVGPFSRLSVGGPDTGQTVGGEGWYRKEFVIRPEDADKVHMLYFEGAYNQAEVWVNGQKACFNPYGYMPFKVNLNEYCQSPGEINTIAVKVINEGLNSRWYAGSGLYRHVWLIKTDKVYVEEWDTFVDASKVQGRKAEVNLRTVVHNAGVQAGEGELSVSILSPQGEEVGVASRAITVEGSDQEAVSLSFSIDRPVLWSVDSPNLYTASITMKSGDGKSDVIRVPFGIRTLEFSAERGFLLNGKSLKLRGGCLHHDNGLLGAAAIDRAEERKVELLKANGYNAVRCSHNLPSEYFLHACDRLGLLVIDEVFDQWQQAKRPEDYHRYFDEWSEHDMALMVRRDRNHPSIILWSIGNEIAERADTVGMEIAQRLTATIRALDDTRYITAAVNSFWDRRHFTWEKDSERAFRHLDVAGYNYQWQKYEQDHAAFPTRIIYGSESYPKEMAQNWNLVEKYPYIIGDFVWTAVDYLGEAGLGHALELAPGEHNPQFMGWPWFNAWCGDLDLCGDKKPQSYYRDVLWGERPIAMAVHAPVATGKKEVVNGWGWPDELQSWNWKGREGETMTVNVYSREARVGLYLNGRKVGDEAVDAETYTATFELPYEPGELKAVAWKGKKETASVALTTSGAPARIKLTADHPCLRADRNDLAYVKIEVLDAEGRLVPDASFPLEITYSGQGTVIAAGNGCPDDMESFRSLRPKAFRGRAVAIVQPTGEKGTARLTVAAAGLPEATMEIEIKIK